MAGSSAWSGTRSWTWRKASASHHPRPTRNATVPAAVARPVVSVSRHTSGRRRWRMAGQAPPADRDRPGSTGRGVSYQTTAPRALVRTSPPTARASRSARSAVASGRVIATGPGSPRAVDRFAVAGEPSGEERLLVDHVATAARRSAPSSPSSRRLRALASISGSRRGPVQAGQPASHPQSRMRSAAAVMSSSCRSHSLGARPIPPGTDSYR